MWNSPFTWCQVNHRIAVMNSTWDVLEQLVELGLTWVVPETFTRGKTISCICYQALLQVRYQTPGTHLKNEAHVGTLTRKILVGIQLRETPSALSVLHSLRVVLLSQLETAVNQSCLFSEFQRVPESLSFGPWTWWWWRRLWWVCNDGKSLWRGSMC